MPCSYHIPNKNRRCRGEDTGNGYCRNHQNEKYHPETPVKAVEQILDFWGACDRRNTDRAIKCIHSEAFDPTEIYSDRTPLAHACLKDLPNVALELIKSGKINPDRRDRLGRTDFMIACELGELSVVQELLKTGQVDINVRDNQGRTALSFSCLSTSDDIFRLLTEAKAEMGTIDSEKIYRLQSGNANILEKCIDAGRLDVNTVDQFYRTLLMNAVGQHNISFFRKLIAIGDTNIGAADGQGQTALILACQRQNSEMIRELIATGRSNPGAVDIVGNTALIACLYNRDKNFALQLIKTGQSNPSSVNRNKETALTLACEYRFYDVITALVETGDCNINYLDHRGMSSLEYCQNKKFPEHIVQALFDATTDPRILLNFLANSEQGMSLILSKLDFKGLIDATRDPEYSCAICNHFCGKAYTHSCGVQFHKTCISVAVTQPFGAIITANRNLCPNCRQELDLKDLTSNRKGKILSTSVIEALNPKEYHKICKPCKKIFVAGVRGACDDNIELLSDMCSNCVNKTFECPGCGMALEHNGGCRQFSCCKYGADGCNERGEKCDHGSTDFARFCGKKWTLDEIFIRGDYYEESDHESDDHPDSD